jgi:hypothetical protein
MEDGWGSAAGAWRILKADFGDLSQVTTKLFVNFMEFTSCQMMAFPI